MRLFRYMSKEEFALYEQGVEIEGMTEPEEFYTSSSGVCFLPKIVHCVPQEGNESFDFSAEEAFEFLERTVADYAVLAEFEIMDPRVRESWGRYANPRIGQYENYITITEYCVPSYSKETALLVSCKTKTCNPLHPYS